ACGSPTRGGKVMPSKEVSQLLNKLKAQGFSVVPNGSGHFTLRRGGEVIRTVDGLVLTIPSTPTGARWRWNIEASLRRVGINVNGIDPMKDTRSYSQADRDLHDHRARALRQRLQWLLDQGATPIEIAKLGNENAALRSFPKYASY